MIYKAFMSYSHASDGKLAPEVQSALQRFAKPWYRLRALRVFRDKTSLSATPSLWSSIEKALGESEYFILFASPEAAQSLWIEREIDWWLKNNSISRLLIILTEGELVWDKTDEDFDWENTTALPETLRGQFQDEPLYVDLRWARTKNTLSLRHTQFRDAILNLAAPLHSKLRDEMDGEDVRQHRKTRIISAAAVTTIIAFAVAAGLGWNNAIQQRDRAERQRKLAVARQLAAQAEMIRGNTGESLIRSIQLALTSLRYHPTLEGDLALRQGLTLLPMQILSIDHSEDVRALLFSPNGRLLATSNGNTAIIWKFDMKNEVAHDIIRIPHKDVVRALAFSPDSTKIATASGNTAQIRQIIISNQTSRLLKTVTHESRVVALAFSSDGGSLTSASFNSYARFNENTIRITEISTGNEIAHMNYNPHRNTVAVSNHGRYFATLGGHDTVQIWEVATQKETILKLPGFGSNITAAAFSPKARFLATAGEANIFQIWDIETNKETARMALEDKVNAIFFSPSTHSRELRTKNGYRRYFKYLATASKDKTARIWEVYSDRGAREVARIPHQENVQTVAFSHDNKYLATASGKTVMIWDFVTKNENLRLNFGAYNELLAFSLDGKLLATVKGNIVKIWTLAPRSEIATITQNSPIKYSAISKTGVFSFSKQ